MAGSIVAVGAPAADNTSTFVVPLPEGLTGGELLIAFVHNQSTAHVADASVPGWTRVGPSFVASDVGVRFTAAFSHTYVPGDSSPVFSFNQGGRCAGVIVAVTGVEEIPTFTSYIDVESTTNTISVPAWSAEDSLTFEVWAANYGGGSSYAFTTQPPLDLTATAYMPAGTENTGVSRSALAVWSGNNSVASHSITTVGNASHMVAFQLSFPNTVEADLGHPVKYSNGTSLVDAKLKVSDGNTLITPTRLSYYNGTKYPTVDDMLATPGFTIAHRGGSRSWPEMSKLAYIQSALHGYSALEVSLCRTADGVWFGMHDQYLDRTSLGSATTTLNGMTMTWAEVQEHSILGTTAVDNPSVPDQPYYRLDELLEDFGTTHLLLFDPKTSMDHADELLDILDEVPGSTDRFICKFFGVQGEMPEDPNQSWAYKARQRGYKSWGFFYQESDLDYADRWDIVGMDLNASQTAWDNLAAAVPGKPIIGHIAANPTQVATAISKGADGVMVSGVASVPAV